MGCSCFEIKKRKDRKNYETGNEIKVEEKKDKHEKENEEEETKDEQSEESDSEIHSHILINKPNDNIFCDNNEIKLKKELLVESFITVMVKNDSKIPIVSVEINIEEKVRDLIDKYLSKRGLDSSYLSGHKFIYDSKQLNLTLTVAEAGLTDGSLIKDMYTNIVTGGFNEKYNMEVNIKFIKISNKPSNSVYYGKLKGLLKLCLLKEISPKLNDYQISSFYNDILRIVMKILKNGYVERDKNIIETIKKVLQKMKGSNIMCFSEYIDKIISNYLIGQIMNLLDENDLSEIKDIKYRLSKYNKYMELFNKEFEKAKKESIFDFSVISLVIIEREDLEKFEQERAKCPYRVDKILFHGTSIEPISSILKDVFKKSINRTKYGQGVYFTDLLDYCWYYGGINNRKNVNKIPNIGDTFTLIASFVYYDRNGFRKVNDSSYTPKKNEINFAYAGAQTERLNIPGRNKFVGTEYVVWDLDQICPFMSAKLRRNEFCVIWRDNNFSSKPVYNNKYDELFKTFLKERIKYIKQMAKYNIYPCETSEEALKLVERKKYNKIILISNVGEDLGGKTFIDNARKILGNDIISLFISYNIDHLDWIKNYKNALFSNDPNFYEEYPQSFEKDYYIKGKIKTLINKIEKHYNVTFNFDYNFLYYPLYKGCGNYSDLTFGN